MNLFDDEAPKPVRAGSDRENLLWSGEYWLHPLPPAGPLVLGCRWPDRGIPETLAEIDPELLLRAAQACGPVWDPAPNAPRS